MSADPQDLASMLASMGGTGDPAADSAMLPAGQQGLGSVVGGYLKGLIWNPAKQAYDLASKYAHNTIAGMQGDPTADPFLPYHDLQGAAHGAGANIDALAQHPADSAATVASGIWKQASSSPEGAGEALSAFLGPGDIAKGLGALSEGPRLDMWTGPRAETYDPKMAKQVKEMTQAGGATDRQIYDTADRMWNPPANYDQKQPWQWQPDTNFGLTDEGKSTLATANQNAKAGVTLPHHSYIGDLIDPTWKGFEAYPGLKALPVELHGNGPAGGGSYSAEHGTINLYGIKDDFAAHPNNVSEVLLHELQHATQHWEDMPQGGSPSMLRSAQDATDALQRHPSASMDTKLKAQELHSQIANGTGYYQSYRNLAGEANANLPHSFIPYEGQEGYYPFEHYAFQGAGVSENPANHIVHRNGIYPPLANSPEFDHASVFGDYHDPPIPLSGRDEYGKPSKTHAQELADALGEAGQERTPTGVPGELPPGSVGPGGHALYDEPAFRAQGFEGGAPNGVNAAEVVRHEIERGNVDEDSIAPGMWNHLLKRNPRDLMWVGKSKEDLMHAYGPDSGLGLIQHPDDIADVSKEAKGSYVLHRGEDGTLLLKRPGS